MADNVREFVVNSLQQIYEKIRKEDFILVEGTSSAAGSSSSPYLATRWEASIPGITEVFDGLKIAYRIRTRTGVSTGGVVLSIDEENYYPVVLNVNTKITTHYPVGSTILLIFNSTQTVSDVYLTSGTKTTVTGCWQIADYNTNTDTIGYSIRTNGDTLPAKFKTYRYRLLFTSADGNYWVGANASTSINATSARTPTSEKINPFGPIVYYYGTTTIIEANANFGAAYLWQQYSGISLGYSFNTGAALSLTPNTPIYLKCSPQADGSAIIDSTTPYVQSLPSTEDGFIYIFLGIATEATKFELRLEHPVYYYKDGAIRLWANQNENKVLYAASEEDELTSEQKTHNLEVLDSLLIEDNIILSMNLNTPIDMQMNIDGVGVFNFHCQLYSCIKQDDVYHIIFNLPFMMLFGFENGIYKTSTTDGEILVNVLSDFMIIDTNYNVKLPDNSLSNTEKTEYTVNDIAADFSIIGETQSETNLPKYLDAIDAATLTFVVNGNRSYGYHIVSEDESNYYEFWYNTEDKRVRIRVYSDDSVTTYWEYLNSTNSILEIIEEDEEVISTAVNELNSYVHSSYAYILQTIEDNEFVIASTLTEHDERLIEVENALENVNYEETDPTVPNYIKNITQSNINTWNTVSNCVTKTQLTNQSYVTSSTLNTRLSNSSYAGYSYVYAAYSYIIDSMVSNERIIAAGFANHESRITTLEATGGEDNVQSNWNETDSTSDAYILNKPEIPSIEGLATESYVLDKISGLVNSAPGTLDTLNELAAALGNDPAFATTVSTQIGERVTKTELSNQSYVTETSLQSRGYLTSFTETDPVFIASPAHSITGTDITNWNNKVSNVQANWNTTNSSDQSYILNKPEIPSTLDEITDGTTRKLSNYIPKSGATLLPHAELIITDFGPDMFCTVTDYIVQVNHAEGGASAITSNGVFVTNDGEYDNATNYTIYHDDSIVRTIGNSSTTINLPSASGTIALTSDMPAAVTESTVAGWGFTKNTGTLTSETDPTVPSYVKSITQANINAWNSYANVQADWDEYDSSKATYILNKPETYWAHEVNGGLYSTWGGPAGASGNGSLAVGSRALAGGECSLAIGNFVNAFGDNSQAFGINTTAYAPISHVEGNYVHAFGIGSHGEGLYTTTGGQTSHAEGGSKYSYYLDTSSTTLEGITTYWMSFNNAADKFNFAGGNYSHTEGFNTLTSGFASHAEGGSTYAAAAYTHAEGFSTFAVGERSHAEGTQTVATGINSHSEGSWTTAYGDASHAEGGPYNYAGGISSHTEGSITRALGDWSHAEGGNTMSYGVGTHAEGNYSYVIGEYSHGEGINTYTYNSAEHAEGQYNQSHQANTTFGNAGNTIHSIGIGTGSSARKNALEIMQNGNAYFLNIGNYNGTNLTSAKPLHTVISDLSSSIPAAVTESTVSGWGFTKNAAANNATITIQKGGTNVDSFTVNASSNKSINIPNELPSYSSADAGKILSVNSSGQLVWITPVSIYTGSGEPNNANGNDGDIYLQS